VGYGVEWVGGFEWMHQERSVPRIRQHCSSTIKKNLHQDVLSDHPRSNHNAKKAKACCAEHDDASR